MAWLHTAPKPPPGRTKGRSDDDPPPQSRLAGLRARKVKVTMPINPAPFLTDRLAEMGYREAAGMGVAPLSWREIDAWCCRNVDLPPWQARLIRHLSAAYVAEGSRAEAEGCPAPWRDAAVEEDGLRGVLG